jgi:hypothetical protein
MSSARPFAPRGPALDARFWPPRQVAGYVSGVADVALTNRTVHDLRRGLRARFGGIFDMQAPDEDAPDRRVSISFHPPCGEQRVTYDELLRVFCEEGRPMRLMPGRGAAFGEITTEIRGAPEFYFAEDYHQQYLAKVADGYCRDHSTGVACPVGLGVAATRP